MIHPGTVYWFTGLSGSGKSTLASLFVGRLRETGRATVLLDGDELRAVLQPEGGHTAAERRVAALRNSRLCRLLAAQGLDVVCATISMFHECHKWNREHLPNYREIYVRVPMAVLEQRDSKGLYARARRAEIADVVGVDIPAEEPLEPDLIIVNDGRLPPAAAVDDIWRTLFP